MRFDEIAAQLEGRGWKREVAGSDFDLGCRIVAALQTTGKGLVLSGDYGSGKTSFVRAIMPHANFYALPTNESIFNPDRFSYDCVGSSDIILDDVGCEHTTNDYGVHIEAFADFVTRWHGMKKPGRLFITTNLSMTEFDKRYGGRVVSRLKDLCVAARFTGGDKREWTIVK